MLGELDLNLESTTMLDNLSRVPCATPVTGQSISHLRYNAVERAFAGADFVRGRIVLHHPTIKQAADLFRVSPSYIEAALKADIYKRLSVLQGCEPLIPPKPKLKNKPETLAERLVRATPAERVMAAREIGVATVWDEMVTPLLETEGC
jgi:hypothetical protein